MTYPAGALAVPFPAFRDIREAQAWCEAVYDHLVRHEKAFAALLAQTRRVQASAIASLSLATLTDPADTPADADVLRDDLVANTIPSQEARNASIQTAVNAIIAAMRTNKDVAT